MSISLFNRSETLYRTNSNNWYYGEDGRPVFSEDTETITCSIQPYRDGKNTFRVPEGFQSIYGIKVYSKEQIIANDEVLETLGDEIEYEGQRFVCIDVANFTGHGLTIPEHYLALFYRKDRR
jgi:hypothetical protein